MLFPEVCFCEDQNFGSMKKCNDSANNEVALSHDKVMCEFLSCKNVFSHNFADVLLLQKSSQPIHC